MYMYVQLVISLQLNQLNACQEEHEKKEQLLAQMEASFKKKADAYFEMESKLILREKAIQHDFQAFTKVYVPRNLKYYITEIIVHMCIYMYGINNYLFMCMLHV